MRNKLFIQTLLLEVLLLSVSVVSASAYDFEVDGIYYNILSEKQKTVEVTYKDSIFDFPSQRWYYYRFSNDYSGDIIVPSIVEYNGQNYTVKRIGNYAFFSGEIERTAALGDYINTVYKDHTITSIVLPPTLESIGYMSFAYTDISSIEIPSNVTYCYGKWNLRGMDDKFNPFMWCKVNKVVINDNAIMPPYVFYGCGVDTLVLGENVTFVDADDCPPFTGELAVSFLEHVETLPIRAFYNWTCLYDVSLPPKMSHISDSVFYGAINLTELKLSKGIKSIGKYAFSGCQSLKTISIPAWATISSYAFQHCANLETITIPDRISNYAFAGCNSLKEIYINNPLVTPIDEEAFTTSAYNYATLYVPVGTSDLYSRRMGWRNFFFIKEWDAPDYIEENVKEISSLQIEANGGVLIIQSIPNGIPISVYNVTGAQVGYAVSIDGEAAVYINLQKGDIAIVKIGQQTKRVIMK